VKEQTLSKTSLTMAGATPSESGCEFRLWAPAAGRVTLRLFAGEVARDLDMPRAEDGTFVLQAHARPGDRYFYIVDGQTPVPDPVSRLLPEGVHGRTEIVYPDAFQWSDQQWRGLSLEEYVIYELHIGTFTPQGTFEAAIEKLPYLRNLGVTVLEIMPVAAFPGSRNWGYDGVSLYAVQSTYGGPEGFKRLVNAAHRAGLAVILDVVYNHLGNEGNYLRLFGPYFTDRHTTPWGEAVNYDQPGCEGVRRFVVENALYWLREYHLDGLRLDAVQTIRDESSEHILREITAHSKEYAQETGRQICVIAESDENDSRLVDNENGYGLDAVWSDDFHHAIHAFFTGERKGYYQDFGRPQQIARALQEGFVFQGEPFRFWEGRPRGTSSRKMPSAAHVFCTQNHDQVGNRAQGERLSVLIPKGARMVAAALLLLAPETPLLFMGQEFDETNPFQFFTDYGDPTLQTAVSEGRRNEFKEFGFQDIPDPQDPATFERSKLNWTLAQGGNDMLAWYTALLELRRKIVVSGERTCRSEFKDGILSMQLPARHPRLRLHARLQGEAALPEPDTGWTKTLSHESDGFAVAVYEQD
jgi:maltooligosyltrehalose trehalohydrolase